MEIGEIISESFRYPFSEPNAFMKVALFSLLLAVPVFIMILGILSFSGSNNSSQAGMVVLVLYGIYLICALIYSLIMGGYNLSVMKEGINHSGALPAFDLAKNIVDSIKLWILSIIYSIVPIIVVTALFFVVIAGAANSSSNDPSSMFAGGFLIVALVAIILGIIFGILLLVATLRFANTDSLSEGLKFSAVFDDIKQIGIGKILILVILLGIIIGVIALLSALISLIPIIGFLVILFFISPFIQLFLSYAYGLLYSDIA